MRIEPCSLGGALPAGFYFSDDNAGQVLDHLFETGTQRIFSALSVAAMDRFALTAKHVHFDTTSVNVFGDYANTNDAQATANITYGYSKDKRPDLKQFVLSMLCVEGDPIVGKHEDGNTSDKKINHRVLGEVARHLREHGVAEEAFISCGRLGHVTEENLARAGRFITRLPPPTPPASMRFLRRSMLITGRRWAASPPRPRPSGVRRRATASRAVR
ncbi:IS1634 family transposase [Lamprobacter modestohalophilus]|uniref:IS1634 family transposase n=1 Tax=Lamprobacter modestohalophilus TaxID=1064514 RepID=UPI002ADEC497|nr:IS1634 family transposase [Lamprobacter modestohalophilus]MEA1048326.1 IS1634 family transposase [Lamprobacter modestohalophilus]